MFTALRRLQEEDPTIDLHRDAQTGEQIVAGLSQVHVEVIVERLHRASGRKSTCSHRAFPTRRLSASPPRRTDATRSRPAAAASSATVTSRSRRCRPGEGFEFVNAIKGGVIPNGFIPAVEKGVHRGDGLRGRRGLSGQGRQVKLSTAPITPSTPRRWRSRSPARSAMKQALAEARPVLLEPIMLVTRQRARGCRRRRDRRPELASRASAGHGAGRAPG